jgi:3,4-dihydroxy-2-butanone 4-phosphate synthase
MKELAGANMMLQRIGETEAAVFLGALAQSLQAIDD